jgi:hypothetical protein
LKWKKYLHNIIHFLYWYYEKHFFLFWSPKALTTCISEAKYPYNCFIIHVHTTITSVIFTLPMHRRLTKYRTKLLISEDNRQQFLSIIEVKLFSKRFSRTIVKSQLRSKPCTPTTSADSMYLYYLGCMMFSAFRPTVTYM